MATVPTNVARGSDFNHETNVPREVKRERESASLPRRLVRTSRACGRVRGDGVSGVLVKSGTRRLRVDAGGKTQW